MNGKQSDKFFLVTMSDGSLRLIEGPSLAYVAMWMSGYDCPDGLAGVHFNNKAIPVLAIRQVDLEFAKAWTGERYSTSNFQVRPEGCES